ncbi:MAG: fasciclin domain-containing protein [Chloroflexi bacterium]|nr:fasciclin domain-containing protein [Chloroflexota bacterium]
MTTNLPPIAPTSVREFATRRRGGSRVDITDLITYLFLIVGVIIMFGPVIWLVMSSFKDESLIKSGDPTFLPYRQAEAAVAGYEEPLPVYDLTFQDTYFNDAKVILPDIRADNGTIHGIDKVLVPDALAEELRALADGTTDIHPSEADIVELEGTLLDVLQGQERFTVFNELVAVSSVGDVLAGEERYTLLAPTDEAWVAFEAEYGSIDALIEIPTCSTVCCPTTFSMIATCWSTPTASKSHSSPHCLRRCS